jgi:predicted phosphodiesterase
MWTVLQEKDSNVHTIKYVWSGTISEYILLASDQHYDNPKCNRDLFHEHLEQALERNSPIIIPGDFFCLMQGKYDPRKSFEGVRPEHRKEDYLGAVVETSVKALEKYAHLFAVVGYGNHETNILNRHGIDVIKMFCRQMREVTGLDHPYAGGYRGWVNINFKHKSGSAKETKRLFYSHGAGGGGAVTKGTIKAHRRAASVDGADVIVSGHVHEYWNMKSPKFRLSASRRVEHFQQRHIQLGTYKGEITDGAMGWANEKEFFPKPLGGYWLKFTRRRKKIKINVEEAD